MIDNVNVIQYPSRGYKEIQCLDGHYITNWNKVDILEFTDTKLMVAPIDYDINNFYCISEEEHNNLMEQQLEKLQEMEKNNNV